ncbi:MAG: hypothetical protein MK165_19185 [Pirellulaceae bacterium]|nr:hypothetical protein [Pirellulaceae bacterium]
MSYNLGNRRSLFQIITAGLASLLLRPNNPVAMQPALDTIKALLPRDDKGRHFVLYSDCCSGTPGTQNARNLQAVNQVVSRISPAPEFIAFPGDAIGGYTDDYAELRRQWRYWLEEEMSWLQDRNLVLYQSTSNHNTYDAGSEQTFREMHPDLPQNGPPDQRGLAYYVRRDNLLYISTHQPDQQQLIDHAWLSQVLTKHADCPFKIVSGHFPVFPVNGYLAWPNWCFPPEERRPFWDILVEHKVDAYLASHIIAFDVQVHDGLLQILSGGAGTNYGPDGFMPGTSEYLHAVQIAIDQQGLRYQVHGTQGEIREQLSWPLELPTGKHWKKINPPQANDLLSPINWPNEMVAFQVSGQAGPTSSYQEDQTILCGIDRSEGVEPLWIGIDGDSNRLVVRIVPLSGHGWQVWKGPRLKPGDIFDFQIAFHAGMGPGGILFRQHETDVWSTLESTSSKGTESLKHPQSWALGYSQSGSKDRAFRGDGLQVRFTRHALSPF